jgi:hypothetical protein
MAKARELADHAASLTCRTTFFEWKKTRKGLLTPKNEANVLRKPKRSA